MDYTRAFSLTPVDINRIPFKTLSSEWTYITCPRKTGTQLLSWVSAIVRMTLCSRRLRPRPRRHLRGRERIVSQNATLRYRCIRWYRYNSTEHPIAFHKAQDLGKAPKKLTGAAAPEAYEVRLSVELFKDMTHDMAERR